MAPADLEVFFEHARDPVAVHQAAFTAKDPSDRAAFQAHWAKVLANPAITVRTVLHGGQVVGYLAAFPRLGRLELGGWLGRAHGGRGIATAAVAAFLPAVTERPIYARTACDNAAAIRVLERSGFTLLAKERTFANGRGGGLDECLYYLRPAAAPRSRR